MVMMVSDSDWGTAIKSSHAPRVGAGEPRTSTTSRRMEGAPAAATLGADGPDLLGRAIEAVDELACLSAGVRPETVVWWHREGFRRYWAWWSRCRRGRPVIRTELRES